MDALIGMVVTGNRFRAVRSRLHEPSRKVQGKLEEGCRKGRSGVRPRRLPGGRCLRYCPGCVMACRARPCLGTAPFGAGFTVSRRMKRVSPAKLFAVTV